METEKETPTWTVAVYGSGVWGCGNTHNEALNNAVDAGAFRPKQDRYTLYLFTRPVKNVWADAFAIRWEWAGEKGEFCSAEINEPRRRRSKK